MRCREEKSFLSIRDGSSFHIALHHSSGEHFLAEEVAKNLGLNMGVAGVFKRFFEARCLALSIRVQFLKLPVADVVVFGVPTGEGRVNVIRGEVFQIGCKRMSRWTGDANVAIP